MIEFYEKTQNRFELYDLGTDIGEKNNLINVLPEKSKELKQILKDWKVAISANLPTER